MVFFCFSTKIVSEQLVFSFFTINSRILVFYRDRRSVMVSCDGQRFPFANEIASNNRTSSTYSSKNLSGSIRLQPCSWGLSLLTKLCFPQLKRRTYNINCEYPDRYTWPECTVRLKELFYGIKTNKTGLYKPLLCVIVCTMRTNQEEFIIAICV